MSRSWAETTVWLILCMASLVCPALGADLTEQAWRSIAPIYRKTILHPFLQGLTRGDLPRERFDFYLKQDALYLGEFSRALSILAAKAPRQEWGLTLNRHALETLEVERQLHESLVGPSGGAVSMAPTNRAYANHLIATVSQRPFAEGLAAMLPCYWIYWEVGKELKKRGSKDADYQRWIDQYAGEEYGATVRQVLAMMNAEAARLESGARERALELFEISSRYEYMFWDMAWRMEAWPP